MLPASPADAALVTSQTSEGVVVSGGTLVDTNFFASPNIIIDTGSIVLGDISDTATQISSGNQIILRSGDISIVTSGTKVSGALLMRPDNSKTPQVEPGTTNTYIPNNDPALTPAVHSISGVWGIILDGTNINLGAPRYADGTLPSAADIAKSWEGTRLDLVSQRDILINSGDFRVANIAYPIKQEANSALRFDAKGAITVSGGNFTLEGQGVPNPARSNYDAPSLLSIIADDNVTVQDGTFDIKSARMHLNSRQGKVIIDGGIFNIDNTSQYPAWQTYDVVGGSAVVRQEAGNTQDKYGVFGSLDIASELEINGGIFNVGSLSSLPGSNAYINMANYRAVFNGGTFNLYGRGNFGNNKAEIILNGGTYNMINGGSFGGRNTNGPAVDIHGGEYNFAGNGTIYVATEAAYLENSAHNKTSIAISGGTFNYGKYNAASTEIGTIQADYSLDISGGDFIRKADGLNSATAFFNVTGQSGSLAAESGDLNISGGSFRTENPVNYAAGVEVSRDNNIRLYDQNNEIISGVYALHTEASINTVFSQSEVDIKAAFAPVNNPDYLPTKDEVLAALNAANSIASARTQKAWDFAAAGNINITGGLFDFNTVNAASMQAGKELIWDGGIMAATGGGGDIDLIGKEGIHIKSGSISSTGSADGTPFALKYDDRGRLNRDRWTLGGYLNFKSDGDIILGDYGTAGPSIYYSEGMIGFAKATTGNSDPASMYLRSGSLTLAGHYRSTLTVGTLPTIIEGGTLNIFTADRINRNGVDSASMWTFPLTMTSGAVNLSNSQLINTHEIAGGVVTMTGDSAMTNSDAVMNISGGTINVGERSYIGAIKGDSLALSPYPTASNGIVVSDGAILNFGLINPGSGNVLTVGTHVGGLYSTKSGANVAVSDGAAVNFNVATLGAGSYTAAAFAESDGGAVIMNDRNMDMPFYTATLTRQSASTVDLELVVKDNYSVFAALPANSNVRDNATALRDLTASADGDLGAVMNNLFLSADTGIVTEGFRQITNENALGAVTASRGNTTLFTRHMGSAGSLMSLGKSSDMAAAAGGSVWLADSAAASGKDANASVWFADNGTVSDSSNKGRLLSSDGDSITGRNRLWFDGIGNWAKQRDKDGTTGFKTSAGGFALGYDYTTTSGMVRIGAAIGYLDSDTDSNDDLTEFEGETWLGGLYASIGLSPVVIDLGLSYSRTDNDMETKIRLPGLQGKNSASFDTETWMLYAKGSYPIDFNGGATVVAPYIGIEYLYVDQKGFTERGVLERKVGSTDEDIVTIPVGLRVRHTFKLASTELVPEAGIAYARDLSSFRSDVRTSYYAGTSMTARGVDMDKNALRFDAGLNAVINDSFSVFARYDLEAREKYTSNQVTAGVKFSF